MRVEPLIIEFVDGLQTQCARVQQWEQGVELILRGLEIHEVSEVRFSNEMSAEAIRVIAYPDDGALRTRIPNIFLQVDLHIVGTVWVSGNDMEREVARFHIAVLSDTKPEEMSTDPEDVHYSDDLATLLSSANEALARSELVNGATVGNLQIAMPDGTTRTLQIYVKEV